MTWHHLKCYPKKIKTISFYQESIERAQSASSKSSSEGSESEEENEDDTDSNDDEPLPTKEDNKTKQIYVTGGGKKVDMAKTHLKR